MKFWKKKIKYEYGFNIKKIKLKNEYGHSFIYIAYKTNDSKGFDVVKKIFTDLRDVWIYLRDEEVTNNE
jgi:hypothetical protein